LSLILGLLLSHSALAQFSDDFSDDDFSGNPAWTGDNLKFTIDNFRLRLQAPTVTSTAYLSTPSQAINNADWEFTVRLEFNPSSSNYTRVYLVSNQANLSEPLNGYFVIIGDTPDEVSLYRQSGSSITKIVDGLDGSVNLSTVDVAVKVTRDNLGNWELFSDVGITGTYTSEGTAIDNTFNASTYFGILCTYTSTRSDKFYFDDFNIIGDPYVDVDSPTLLEVEVLSSQEIVLHFNEPIDPVTSTDPLLYALGSGIVHPAEAVVQPGGQSIKLSFNQHFQNGFIHSLMVNGVKDLVGNALTTTRTFLYFQPMPVHAKDIIITEIFSDPSPQVNLPDAEYVEIYNRSINPINILGWTLSDGSSLATLPDKIILPDEYRVITSSSNVSKFGTSATVLGVSNFPTLNNSGDTLTIKTPAGETIDSLNYNLSWYRNIDKQEGGWSLELIDLNNPCAEEENWTASENESGGTPGEVNSVFANKPDLTGPQLVSAIVISSSQLLLFFNEKLASPISNAVAFTVSPNIEVINYFFKSKALRSIVLDLSTSIAARQLYTITVENLFDCNGNNINSEFNTANFALHENAEAGDVLINEILFNPRPNGVDFVELYNNSDKYINLKDLNIGNISEELIENSKSLSSSDLILAPSTYLVLTSDPITLKSNYPQGKEEKFIPISLPSFPDDKGSVAISDNQNSLIDYFSYDEDFHSPFIKDEEGVSLERISFTSITNTRENWTSASSTANFATPGYINSNFRSGISADAGEVEVYPPIIVPASGGSDFSQINFRFDQSGFVANVRIIDHQGRLIKTLANNVTLGQEGSFRWEGEMEDGNKARAGYYIVWFEVFNASGNVKTYRKRVIIALR